MVSAFCGYDAYHWMVFLLVCDGEFSADKVE